MHKIKTIDFNNLHFRDTVLIYFLLISRRMRDTKLTYHGRSSFTSCTYFGQRLKGDSHCFRSSLIKVKRKLLVVHQCALQPKSLTRVQQRMCLQSASYQRKRKFLECRLFSEFEPKLHACTRTRSLLKKKSKRFDGENIG